MKWKTVARSIPSLHLPSFRRISSASYLMKSWNTTTWDRCLSVVRRLLSSCVMLPMLLHTTLRAAFMLYECLWKQVSIEVGYRFVILSIDKSMQDNKNFHILSIDKSRQDNKKFVILYIGKWIHDKKSLLFYPSITQCMIVTGSSLYHSIYR